MKWEDTTNRYKGESKKAPPRQWTLQPLGDQDDAMMVIYRGTSPGWFMHCYGFGIDDHTPEIDPDKAKLEFLRAVHAQAKKLIDALESFEPSLKGKA